MIVTMDREQQSSDLFKDFVSHYDAFVVNTSDNLLAVTSSNVKELEDRFSSLALKSQTFPSDMQLSSKEFMAKRQINVGSATIGDDKSTVFIAGPCSVESKEQIREVAAAVKSNGGQFFRAGAYKPRTSPYSFQGLGKAGIMLLRETCDEYGLNLVTEVRDATHADVLLEHADVVQIGAKAMYDHGVLKACGNSDRSILLKRGFSSTLQETVQAAEFILSSGNPNVMVCERGIRTFETKTRFTLDLCGVAYLKEHTNLPIIVDPSHAMGYAYGVPDLAKAAFAMGIDGLLIEVHPDPSVAKSDASQQLTIAQYKELHGNLKKFESAVGRSLS